MKSKVIARLSVRKMVPWIVGLLVVTLLVFWIAWNNPGARHRDLVLVIAPFSLLGVAILFHQVFLDGGRAAWIADDKLNLGWGVKIPLADIESVEIGDYVFSPVWYATFTQKSILLKLRDGSHFPIDARHLSEPTPVVLARLRDALGLPKTA